MEIGLSSASFYPYVKTEDSISLMKRLGFESGEIFLNSPSEYEESFVQGLLEERIKHNFKIHSIHSFSSSFEPYLFDSYKRRRDDMFVYFKKVCKAAKTLGADCYTFHGMKYQKLDLHINKFIMEIYDQLAYTALEEGVKLAQENVSWCMSSNTDFLRLINEKCKYPVYFTLDIKQAYKVGLEPEKYIEVMGNNIINFHVNDKNKDNICLLPGKGDVDYKKLYCKLKGIGYNSIGIIEVYSDNYAKLDEISEAKKVLMAQLQN